MALASIQATPEIITSDQYDHTDVREEAEFLYRQGFQIIPMAPGSKICYQEGWPSKSFKPSDFSATNNIAIKTGTKHGSYTLICFDVDISRVAHEKAFQYILTEIKRRFGETPTVYSGGRHKGAHLKYLYKGDVEPVKKFESRIGNLEIMASFNHPVLTAPSVVEERYTCDQPLILNKLPKIEERISPKEIAGMLSHVEDITEKRIVESVETSVLATTQPSDYEGTCVKKNEIASLDINKTIYSSIDVQIQPHSASLPETLRLSSSLSLWQYMLQDERFPFPRKNPVQLGKSFPCVMREDVHPSAALFKKSNGSILYKDFSLSTAYDIIQMYAYLNSDDYPQPPFTADKSFLSFWSTQLKNEIKAKRIPTGFADDLIHYKDSLDLTFLSTPQQRISLFLLELGIQEKNAGNSYFIATERYIADTLHLPLKTVNRSTNQLVFLGLLRKGTGHKIKQSGVTFKYTITPVPLSELNQRWAELKTQGLSSINKFNHYNIKKIYGQDIANVVFRSNSKDEFYDGSNLVDQQDFWDTVTNDPALKLSANNEHLPQIPTVEPSIKMEIPSCVLIYKERDLIQMISTLEDSDEIACALQSVSEDANHLHYFSLANKTESFTIDWLRLDESGKALFCDFMSKDRSYVFQNTKACFKLMENEGIPLPINFFDIYLAEKLINHEYKAPVNFPLESLLAKKASLTQQLLHNYQLMDTAELEFKTLFATLQMEKNGIEIDIDRVQQLHEEMLKQKTNLKDNIAGEIGKEVNLNSPQQLIEALNKRGYDLTNTKKETLSPLAENEPLIADILDFRKIQKQLEKPKEIIKAVDKGPNRIYSHYNQLGTQTGRFSCTDFNIQQVPKNKAIRSCFIPADGNVFVVADYSQIQLRIAAEISNDTNMIQAYVDDKDFHTETAALINDIAPEQVTPEMRKAAKALNFGILFGMGAKSFMEYAKNDYGIHMSKDQAKEYIKRFFDAYPDFKHWKKTVMNNYDMRTLGNRGFFNVKKTYTQRLNFPIQGSEADILKTALCLLTERLKGTTGKIVTCIHDEIMLECAKEEGEKMKRTLQNSMEEAGSLYLKKVPVVAEAEIRKSWAD